MALSQLSQVSLKSLSDLSQVSVRSVSGLSLLFLSSLLNYFVEQMEPKILCPIKDQVNTYTGLPRYDPFVFQHQES